MEKSILIVGAGPGLSNGIAEKFGKNGYQVGLISRNSEKLKQQQQELNDKGIVSFFAVADAGNENQLEKAIAELQSKLGSIDILVYNPAPMKMMDILEESVSDLTEDFRLGVANAVHCIKLLHKELKRNKGAVLLTGGGFSLYPMAQFGSLSLAKAGIRNLAFQLNERLKDDGIFVGTVTINGSIHPDSKTHSPLQLADDFWLLAEKRSEVEIQH